MDISDALSESFEYAKEAVWGKWMKWILFLVCIIIFPLIPIIFGYQVDVMRGKKPAPELKGFLKLWIDGFKYLVIGFLWMLPAVIVFLVFLLPFIPAIMSGSMQAILMAAGAAVIGLLLAIVVAFIMNLFAIIGVIRFARTGSMGQGFSLSAILATIRGIGWGTYIFALIALWFVVFAISFILSLIPYLGFVLLLIVAPAVAILVARYQSQLYDSAGPAPAA